MNEIDRQTERQSKKDRHTGRSINLNRNGTVTEKRETEREEES